MLNSKKGQSTLEYAIIIAVVVAALLAMQFYMKRGVQGKLRSSTDEIGEQFSPTYTSNYTTESLTNTTETVTAGGATTTNIHSATQDKTGSETVTLDNQLY